MMECKKALVETDGDMDRAIDELRKKGLAKAAKKADRETMEGAIKIITDGGKAYIVSISCETDFLANSDKFNEMLEDDDIEWCNIVRKKIDTVILSQAQYDMECG